MMNDLVSCQIVLKDEHLVNDETLKSETKKLQQDVQQLQKEVRELEIKQEEDDLMSIMCNLPSTIEQMIVREVLPASSRDIHTIKDMEYELNQEDEDFDEEVFANKAEKQTSVQKWENLQSVLEWDCRKKLFKRSMKAVKEYRINMTHRTLTMTPDKVKEEFEKLVKIKSDDLLFKSKIKSFNDCLFLYDQLWNTST